MGSHCHPLRPPPRNDYWSVNDSRIDVWRVMNTYIGSVYTGEYRDDKKVQYDTDSCLCTLHCATHLLTCWVHVEQDGAGEYRFANGNCYVGEYKDGKSHGIGRYIVACRIASTCLGKVVDIAKVFGLSVSIYDFCC
jgi:MORN repeat